MGEFKTIPLFSDRPEDRAEHFHFDVLGVACGELNDPANTWVFRHDDSDRPPSKASRSWRSESHSPDRLR